MKETYQIPMAVKPEIDKAIERIQKKAAIYGKLFSVEQGDTHFEKRRCFADDFGVVYEIGAEFVEVYDLTIESEIVKRDGFEIVARIEHLEGGNIVQMFSEDGAPSWSHILPCCEHCRSKRKRNPQPSNHPELAASAADASGQDGHHGRRDAAKRLLQLGTGEPKRGAAFPQRFCDPVDGGKRNERRAA